MSDFPVSESSAALDTEPAVPSREPGSLGKRVVDTFFSPIALFRRLGPNAPFADVLVISAVLTAVLVLLMPRDLMVAQLEAALRNQPQGGPTPDVDTMVMIGRILGVVSQLVLGPLIALGVAGVCTLLFGMLMGGGARFRQHLAVVSHAGLVTPLGLAVTMAFMLLGDNPTAQLSLALLVPGLEAESFAFRLLNGMTVFMLWWVALIGVGASAVNRRVSPYTGVGVVFAAYLAIAVLVAAAGG
jgi:hypothetical protein